MAKLTVDQMVQLANQAKSQSNNQKTMSVDEMVALAKSNKPTKDLGTLPPMKFEAEKPSFLVDVGSGMDKVFSGVKQGVHWFGDKAAERSNTLLGTNFDTNDYEKYTKKKADERKTYNEARKASGKGFNFGELLGEVAAFGPLGAGGVGRSVATTAAKSGGLGALIGGVQFAENSDERLKNAGAGAVGGALGGVAAKKIGDGLTRVVNAKKGNYRDGVKEVLDQGAKHNVRVSVGDAGQNPHIKRTESVLDRAPFIGTSKFREAQQKEAAQAASKVVDGLHQKLNEVDYKSLDKIRAAASAGNPNAIRIMKVVNGAGDDTGKILQAAAEIKNWRGERVASQMYDRVSRMAGDAKSPATNMLKAIDEVIAKDSKTIPNTDLLNELNKIKSNWSNPSNPQNFRELQSARSRLGELINEWGAGNKKTTGLSDVRKAINADMDDIARSSGNPTLLNEYGRANAFYTQLQIANDKALGKAMSSKTPDEIYNQFVRAGKGDRAANFYKNLDPKGQAALRYEMANQALNKATHETTGAFSPAVFAREFEKLNAPYSQIFTKNHKAEMDGFVKLMRHIEQAGQYSSNPTNGSMVILPASGIGLAKLAMSEPITAAATVGSIYSMSRLFTTSAGRRILLAAKDLPPDSPKLANLIKQAQKLATTSGAAAATD